MSNKKRHAGLTAEHAVRLALGAYYNAAASKPDDHPDLLGRWMLALSEKMQSDEIIAPHYAEIIRRWQAEDDLRKCLPENAQVATLIGGLDNALTGGLQNA